MDGSGFRRRFPLTGYTVTASDSQQTCTTTGATMCTVTGLTDGHRHEINVRASNARGEGHASTGVQVTPLPSVSFASAAELFSGTIAVLVTLSQSLSMTVQVGFTTSNGPNGGMFVTYFIGDAAGFSPSGHRHLRSRSDHRSDLVTVNTPHPGGCPVGIPAAIASPTSPSTFPAR